MRSTTKWRWEDNIKIGLSEIGMGIGTGSNWLRIVCNVISGVGPPGFSHANWE
jgi:hypothetical protein